MLRITIQMYPNGRIEIDPQHSRAAIAELDRLYAAASREDYDKNWPDDRKIAYFQYQVFDEILAQYEPSAADIDPTPGVPTLQEAPIRDVIDIDTMPRANAIPLN